MHLSLSSPRGGSGNPRKFDCHVYPQGSDFDQTSRPQGGEPFVNVLYKSSIEALVHYLLLSSSVQQGMKGI